MSSRMPSLIAVLFLCAASVLTATGNAANEPVTPMTPDIVPSFDAFDLAHRSAFLRL